MTAVSIMAKGCIVAWVLPLRCFLVLLPNFSNILVFLCLFALFSDEPEVFLPKYSQTAKRHAAHFWRGVNVPFYSRYTLYEISSVFDNVNLSEITL